MIERPMIEVPAPETWVTVDLKDENGKVVQREQGHNFVATNMADVMKWAQRWQWYLWHPNQAAADNDGLQPLNHPRFMADHIAYWNDSSSESSTTEYGVNARVVGWAGRLPVSSPTGKRGVVDASSTVSSDGTQATWVFNWGLSQGNGTFQSVGWTRIDELQGIPWTSWPDQGTKWTVTGRLATSTNSNTGGGGLHWDGTYFYTIDAVSNTGTAYRVSRANTNGGSWASYFAIPTGDSSSSTNNSRFYSLTSDGTNWFLCGFNQPVGQPIIIKYDNTGTKLATSSLSLGSAVSFLDITWDGVALWCAGSNGRIYSVDPSTLSVTATVTPDISPTSLSGIAWDSARSLFWLWEQGAQNTTSRIWQVNSSGVHQGREWSMSSDSRSGTAGSPYSGTYTIPGLGNGDPYVFYHNTGSASGPVNSSSVRNQMVSGATNAPMLGSTATVNGYTGATLYRVGLVIKGGEPYICDGITYSNNASTVIGQVRGNNLGTRIRLTNPVTKDSTKTLTITYTFNFS